MKELFEILKSIANGLLRLEVITAAPILVMGYHIYEFYGTDPQLIRVLLAISFDLFVVVLFKKLNDKFLKSNNRVKWAIYSAIIILVAFQGFVNIQTYIHQSDSFISYIKGAIFPVIVGISAYIITQSNHERERAEERQAEKQAKKQSIQENKAGEELVAELIDQGKTAKQIIDETGMSKSSVYYYINKLKRSKVAA